MSRTSSVTDQMLREAEAANPTVAQRLRAALGARPTGPLTPEDYPVAGYWVTAEGDNIVVFLVTPGRFLRVEQSPTSDYLTIAVPHDQIRRIEERHVGGTLTVTIEFDADRNQANLEGVFTTPNDGERGQVEAIVTNIPTRYELTAPSDQTEQHDNLATFAAATRNVLGL